MSDESSERLEHSERLKRLIEDGRAFGDVQLEFSRSHSEDSGYLEDYPAEFDIWIHDVRKAVLDIVPNDSVESSLVSEVMHIYGSFKTFKNIKDFKRIHALLMKSLEKAEAYSRLPANRTKVPEKATDRDGDTVKSPRKEELELQLKRLENERELSLAGLLKGSTTAIAAMVSVLATIGLAILSVALTDTSVISGTHIVIIAALVVFGLVAYFSFVFRRRVKLNAEIEETRAKLELLTGEDGEGQASE